MADLHLDVTDAVPDEAVILAGVVVLEAIHPDGDRTVYLRVTEGVTTWATIGLLTVALDTHRADAQAGFIEGDEDVD